MDNTSLKAVVPKLLSGVLAALVGALTNDAATEGNGRRADEQLKRLKNLVLVDQQVDGSSLGALIGYLADVFVAAYGGHWCDGPHQVPVAHLDRPADRLVGCPGVRKLLSFSHGANIAVGKRPLECDPRAFPLA